ncbi:MAG TPA: AraC family transcriptional regulator [Candidatus Cloacimonetes bacterium]|nr:AraC family transcriptional regulator [Candidatus Cloacimonadota bacterium]HEX37595.1 AraC family transcriptional regulator [Candidatus Cloacimonadota bacterium]
MKKTAIIISFFLSILLLISCVCPHPRPMTNIPPEPQLPIAPKTVSPLPEIVTMDEFTLIGKEKDFTQETMKQIPQMWMDFMGQEDQIQNMASDTEAWGVSYNMDYSGSSMAFTYFVGAEVTSTDFVPEGMIVHVVPASKYAKFTHYGSLEDLSITYYYIYNKWLPQSGYDTGDGDELELYDERFNPEGINSEMFIFTPIK